MKRFIIFSIAGVLMSGTAFAQVWGWQIPPTTNRLYAVVFVDSTRGWAVGDSSTIIHTTDGGGTWMIQACDTLAWFYGVDFTDANNGWVAGASESGLSIILHTTNGGGTWLIQNSETNSPLNDVAFVDANNGWAVGGRMDWPTSDILHTTDGGDTWMYQNSPWVWPFTGVDFVDANNGWAVSSTIVHTTDGGETWTVQPYPDEGIFLLDVDFVDVNNGWVVGGFNLGSWGFIFHTSDGGNTWIDQEIPAGVYGARFGVAFVDPSNGWAVGASVGLGWYEPADILHTTDGGSTWTSGASAPLLDVVFTDANTGWAVGYDGAILHYSGGQSVSDLHSVPQPSSLRLSSYPNPFNLTTTIAYDLPRAGHVSLRVFALLGREVCVLKEGLMEAGTHRVTFDGSGLASGIYFARLDAGAFSQTTKLMLLK